MYSYFILLRLHLCYKRKLLESISIRGEYAKSKFLVQGPPNNFFFTWKCFKKKPLNIFLKIFFYLKVQSFRLIMENNFIQLAASAGHAVAYTIGSIFIYLIYRLCAAVFHQSLYE